VTALEELGYQCGDGLFSSQQAKSTLLLSMAKKLYSRHGADLEDWLDDKLGTEFRNKLKREGDAEQADILEGVAGCVLAKFRPLAGAPRERAASAMKALEKDKDLEIPHLIDLSREEGYPAPADAFDLYLRAVMTQQLTREKLPVVQSKTPERRPSKPDTGNAAHADTLLPDSPSMIYSVDVPSVNLKAIFSGRGHRILAVSQAGHINIFTFPGGELEAKLLGHDGPVYDCDWSSQDVLASGSHDTQLILWDVSLLHTGASASTASTLFSPAHSISLFPLSFRGSPHPSWKTQGPSGSGSLYSLQQGRHQAGECVVRQNVSGVGRRSAQVPPRLDWPHQAASGLLLPSYP